MERQDVSFYLSMILSVLIILGTIWILKMAKGVEGVKGAEDPFENDSKDIQTEGLVFDHPVNQRYWPQYYYSFPYQYQTGGAWPPGMFSRLYNWQPGFNTSGWSSELRPGMYYGAWPRNRWVRRGASYYMINNGPESERQNDNKASPGKTPLFYPTN